MNCEAIMNTIKNKQFVSNRKILYTLVLLLFIAACKYEDGPLSLRSKYQRLEGEWKIEHLEIDGIDSTQRYIDSCNCNLKFIKFDDYGWGDGQLIKLGYCKWAASITTGLEGYWKFSKNKKIFHVWLNINGCKYKGIGPIGCIDSDWEIHRLTKTEFWFTTTIQNKVYTFKFKR
jgi:hypothetical protein